MDTKTNTELTNTAIVPGRTASERLGMDIVEEMKTRSQSGDLYKNDKKQKFIDLRSRGASYQDIASILHCSKSTLVAWNREMAGDIAERRAMVKNDILYDYQVARDNRLRYFSEVYRKLKNEIERRSLRDIPTEKLYAMLEKCSKHIDELSGERSGEMRSKNIIEASRIETIHTALKVHQS